MKTGNSKHSKVVHAYSRLLKLQTLRSEKVLLFIHVLFMIFSKFYIGSKLKHTSYRPIKSHDFDLCVNRLCHVSSHKDIFMEL